jgi:hypothetical protein
MQNHAVKKRLEIPEDNPGPVAGIRKRKKPENKSACPEREGKKGEEINKIFPPEKQPRIGRFPHTPAPHRNGAFKGRIHFSPFRPDKRK